MTQVIEPTVETSANRIVRQPWPWPWRIGFRFCFVYFTLFCLGTPQILLNWMIGRVENGPDYWATWIMGPLNRWVARHVLGMHTVPHWVQTGSGDTTFAWVSLFCWLVIAVVATAVWSLVAWRRTPDLTLHSWFRVVIRLLLAGQMFTYGFIKAFPLQMPSPTLSQLMTPIGELHKRDMLWTFMGASHPYEIACGCAEILAGVLLVLPRTATLGALICMADMTQVFILNMTYDNSVKILSFHLLMMSLFLLAPEFGRLFDIFVRGRAVTAARPWSLFRSKRANRIALVVQLALGLWVGGSIAKYCYDYYYPRPERPALYGVWQVDEYSVGGTPRPPLTTDIERWQRVAFDKRLVLDSTSGKVFMFSQHMDDSQKTWLVDIDTTRHRITVTDEATRPVGTLSYEQLNTDSLTLDGPLDGHHLTVKLHRVDLEANYPLVGPGFHWIHNSEK
ncbi:DoxX family protein [Nocardia brasiliensis]|uniref:DoxX family protein n=1 Tax=Nocardia brasiliensis TaxID=37326 RepID=UPI00245748CF|nr:DoxX family protein [Nocardia brasiliensis]